MMLQNTVLIQFWIIMLCISKGLSTASAIKPTISTYENTTDPDLHITNAENQESVQNIRNNRKFGVKLTTKSGVTSHLELLNDTIISRLIGQLGEPINMSRGSSSSSNASQQIKNSLSSHSRNDDEKAVPLELLPIAVTSNPSTRKDGRETSLKTAAKVKVKATTVAIQRNTADVNYNKSPYFIYSTPQTHNLNSRLITYRVTPTVNQASLSVDDAHVSNSEFNEDSDSSNKDLKAAAALEFQGMSSLVEKKEKQSNSNKYIISSPVSYTTSTVSTSTGLLLSTLMIASFSSQTSITEKTPHLQTARKIVVNNNHSNITPDLSPVKASVTTTVKTTQIIKTEVPQKTKRPIYIRGHKLQSSNKGSDIISDNGEETFKSPASMIAKHGYPTHHIKPECWPDCEDGPFVFPGDGDNKGGIDYDYSDDNDTIGGTGRAKRKHKFKSSSNKYHNHKLTGHTEEEDSDSNNKKSFTQVYGWILGAAMLGMGSLLSLTGGLLLCFCSEKIKKKRLERRRLDKYGEYERVESVSSLVSSVHPGTSDYGDYIDDNMETVSMI